jgi:hypothetical protein
MHLFLIPILLLSAQFLFISCTGQNAEARSTIEVVDGVTVVKNSKEPLHPELQILFEEDLRIGTEHGDENYMFGSRVLINADQEGKIYVSDKDINTIKKYDGNGTFLQMIGGPGQGPGEFQDISEAQFDADGNICLNDVKIQRLTFMSREGEYLQGVKAPQLFERVLVNSQGFYVARSVDNVELGKGKKWDYFYGLFDDSFAPIAELLRLPQKAGGMYSFGYSIAQALADDLSSRAFAPTVSYVLDEHDLLYFGYPIDYEIKVYSSLDGELKKIIRRDYEPIEISGSHKKFFEQNQSDLFVSKMPAGMEKEVFELVEYPEYKPPYERFTLLENGWIFVVVDSMRGGLRLVDIFNQEGEYLAQFETDIPTEQLIFRNGKAYTVATIDDYQYIKRYKIAIVGNNNP